MKRVTDSFHKGTPHKDRLLLVCLCAVLAFTVVMDIIIAVELNLALLS